MANTLLTIDMITREALRILHAKLRFIGSINRQYDDEFGKSGAKIGTSLRIRLPNKYVVRDGATLNTQDTTEQSVTLTVATQKGVDLNFSSVDLTMSLDDFSKRILAPAMAILTSAMEADALNMRKEVYNQVNSTAAGITFRNLVDARKMLVDNLTPEDDEWTALLRTTDNAALVDVLKGLFNSQKELSKQYREGVMGHTAGFDFMESTHMNTQTRGSALTTYVMSSTVATQGSTSLPVQTGTGTFKIGDIVTVAAVNSVHPETKADTGMLQQFVVTADSAGGSVTLAVQPAMYTTGPLQNITAFPQSAAVMVIAGTLSVNYGQSMVYHKDAFTFVTADLVMPSGVDMASRKVFDGISIRIVRNYDINNDKFPCRLDVLYGYKAIRPQMAARIATLA